MTSKRKFHYFVVKVPALDTKRELGNYVRDAVRGWAGGSCPDHPLYKYCDRRKIVVTSTLYEMEKQTLKALKRDVKQYFEEKELSSNISRSILAIIDNYLTRA